MIYKIFTTIFLGLFLTNCSTQQSPTNINPTLSARLNVHLGLSYLQTGNISRAKQKLLTALKQAPQLAEVQQAMGYFLITINEPDLARPYYEKALKIAPKQGEVQNNHGIFLCKTGHYQESINHFKMAIQDPNYLHSASAYQNAGMCALKIPDKKQASQYFKKALNYE